MTQIPQDRSIEEYKTLRAEILQLLNREQTLISFTFTGTGAILGFGVSRANPFLFLVPLLVLPWVLFQLSDSARSVTRIASYIRIFLEKEQWKPSLNYENTMNKLRISLHNSLTLQSEDVEKQEIGCSTNTTKADPDLLCTPMSGFDLGLRPLRSPRFSTASSEIFAILLGAVSMLSAFFYSFDPESGWYEPVICVVVAVYWATFSVLACLQLHNVTSGEYEKVITSHLKRIRYGT